MLPTGIINIGLLGFLVCVLVFVAKLVRAIAIDERAGKLIMTRLREEFWGHVSSAKNTIWLVWIFSAMTVFYLGTTSTYITYDVNHQEADRVQSVQLRVNCGGQVRDLSFDKRDDITTRGGPRFPDFGWYSVSFDVRVPSGQTIDSGRIGVIRTVHVGLPRDLEIKRMRAFRVLPPPRLLIVMPRSDGPATHKYGIRIKTGGVLLGEHIDVRQGSVLFGTETESNLRWYLGEEARDDRQVAYIGNLHGMDAAGAEQIFAAWTDHVQVVSVKPFKGPLDVELVRIADDNSFVPVAKGSLSEPQEEGIQTITLRLMEDG
jgi:hypothetical protein